MKKSFVQYIIVSLIIFAVTGCQDDFMKEGFIDEGKAKVSITLDFKPMSAALTQTRTAGNALKDITSLHVLWYDEEKNLIKGWKIAEYDLTDKNRTDEDAENKHSAEASTKQAILELPEKIEVGKYYMYAVANIPDLLTNETYAEAIKTIEGLKNIPLVWDPETITNNKQMIGYCTNTDADAPQSEDTPFAIQEKNVNLHAWLRRAASKVTVAFDGTGLEEGVSIYLKALRIKNIPKTCKLGAENKVTKAEEGEEINLFTTGEEVKYSTSTNFDASYSALITKEQPLYPKGTKQENEDGTISWKPDPDCHSENNPNSLFFYENMQGKGPDKRQSDEDKDGYLDEIYQYQNMPYATYVEVDAYYESTNPKNPGMSNITYRFMLGQDVKTDYNAKRNCHYKLTLHFKGFADNPDWRIDYVTRFGATQPERVDYRGKYFVPDNVTSNQGNNFSDDNVIALASFMYDKDSWENRIPVEYKTEYKDAGSSEFTETCPDWFNFTTTAVTDKNGNPTGVYKLKINYKNEYTPLDINKTLSDAPQKGSSTNPYDLSTKGGTEMNTANCYIVDAKGTYQFPLVYGNAITNGNENEDSYLYKLAWCLEQFPNNTLERFKNYKDQGILSPYILDDIYTKRNLSVPTDIKCSLVWQDASGLVTDIEYVPDGKGAIQFTIGDNIKEGNAVIALKDPSGTIMWSWHIWVTAFDFSRKVTLYRPYTAALGQPEQNFEIMPVNLGWCSGGIPIRYYDRHECEVRFTQLISTEGQEGVSQTVKIIQEPHIAVPCGNNPYYQWGRKDPFVAAGEGGNRTTKIWYNDASNNANDSGPNPMWEDFQSSNDKRMDTNLATALLIQNPDKWQNCPRSEPGDNGNPYKPFDNIFTNLWDNSNWDENDGVIKTIYDPCPAGYHVSSLFAFSGFTDTGKEITGSLSTYSYSVIENNMMPDDEDNMNESLKNVYRENVMEFYTDRSKLISIGFPLNGYRDWDSYAYVTTFGTNGQIWHSQSNVWNAVKYNCYHFEFSRTIVPHIWPSNQFYATDGFPVRPSKTLP